MDTTRATRWPPGSSVVVLTGGASRRLGRDKATAHVGGRRLVDRILAQVPADVPVVIVGPSLGAMARPVRFVREDPPGCGPLAAIGAGLAEVRTPLVGLIAADMPFAVPVVAEALSRLAHEPPPASHPRGDMDPVQHLDGDGAGGVSRADAVVPIDADGFAQLLCAGYRTHALRRALSGLGVLADRPVRALLSELRVMEWPVPTAELADVDTEDQLTAARSRAAEEDRDMQEWVDAVREALGVDVPLDIDAILDVARDAAHGVDRPAAPVTTYLLGAAVAGGADPGQAAAVIGELARGWASRGQ
ncbi:MAG: molybdenum cofactor guanylyltransferase [Candidatus Nanopelagicales bacterium]|nr:molybdenum cofactor guanylyltransferase [Candidatus Nanopelagicales bacterium]